jgi:hypothetical protein
MNATTHIKAKQLKQRNATQKATQKPLTFFRDSTKLKIWVK